MVSSLKGEQLPITSFFVDYGRGKMVHSKENTDPRTKKRKREQMEESLKPTDDKDRTPANGPFGSGEKSAVNYAIHRETPRHLSSANSRPERAYKIRRSSASSGIIHASTHGSNSNDINFTHMEEPPTLKTSFATPVSRALAAKPRRRGQSEVLLDQQRQGQLMTPPSTDFLKRSVAQINEELCYDSRSPMPCRSPSHGINYSLTSNVASGVGPDTIRVSFPPSTGGFGLPTPGSSVPRVKPRNSTSVNTDLVVPLLRPNLNALPDNDPPSPTLILPAQHAVKLNPSDDDVFVAREVQNSSVPSGRASTLSADITKPDPRVSSHKFKIPALPLSIRSPAKQRERSEILVPSLGIEVSSTSDDVVVATSQSQDLRPFIISPPRLGHTSRITTCSTPKALRISHKAPTDIFSSQLADIRVQGNTPTLPVFSQESIASSQSQEIELRMSTIEASSQSYHKDREVSATAEQFVLADDHLLRTPSKPKIHSLTASHKTLTNLLTPSRRSMGSLVRSSSPATEHDFPSPSRSRTRSFSVKKMHLRLDNAHRNSDDHNCTPPRIPSQTTLKQSLRLFESQAFSPNIPRSFEAWRYRPRDASDSDSVTEFDSEDDEVVGVRMRTVKYDAYSQCRVPGDNERPEADDSVAEQDSRPAARLGESQRQTTPSQLVATCGQLDSKTCLVQSDAPDINEEDGKLSYSPRLPSSDTTEYSNEGETYSETPAQLREFLDMIKGDGSFPDDFPESWRC